MTFLARGVVEDILTRPSLANMAVRVYDRFAISGAEVLGAQAVGKSPASGVFGSPVACVVDQLRGPGCRTTVGSAVASP